MPINTPTPSATMEILRVGRAQTPKHLLWEGLDVFLDLINTIIPMVTFLLLVGDASTALQAFLMSISVTDTQPG